MIPLMRLDNFIEKNVATEDGKPQKYIRLIKMDTEGSEIDILRSGLGLFENKQVHSFVVELGVRHWVENKGVSDTSISMFEILVDTSLRHFLHTHSRSLACISSCLGTLIVE